MDTRKQYTINDVVLAYDITRGLKNLKASVPAYIIKDNNSWEAEVKALNESTTENAFNVVSLIMSPKGIPLIRLQVNSDRTTDCTAIIYKENDKEHPEGLTPIEDTPEGRKTLIGKNVYRVGNPYTLYKLRLNELGTSLQIYTSENINVSTMELFMNYRFETKQPEVEGNPICVENL